MVVWPPPEERRAPNPNARLIVIAAVAAVIIIVVGAVGVALELAAGRSNQATAAALKAKSSPGPVGATTPLTAKTGTSVFSDDFHDPRSGWDTFSNFGIVDYAYSNGSFVITASGDFRYWNPSPYSEPKEQISASVTATLDAHSPSDAGFGIDCVRGSGTGRVRYEFSAYAGARWFVRRTVGESSTSSTHTLAQGSLGSASIAGLTPITLVGVCATAADGVTTRLALFVDGRKLVDLTDRWLESWNQAWLCDLLTVASTTGPVTVTVTHFEERDLSRSGP